MQQRRPPLDVGEIARRLVASEAGDAPDGAAVAAVVQDACARLGGDLRHILGAHGVSALLGRALSLARREHPVLAEVALYPESARSRSLEEALARDGADASAAGASLLAHLWSLLVLLLGESLGMQPVYKLWPHLAPGSKEIAE